MVPATHPDATIPLALRMPPPRAVRRRTMSSGCGMAFMRLFLLPHTLVGIGVILAVIAQPIFLTTASHMQARITQLETHTGSKGGINYSVSYRYRIGAKDFTSKDSISRTEYDQMRAEQPLPIRAVAVGTFHYSERAVSSVTALRQWLMLCFFAAFWNGILSIFLYAAWIVPMRYKRLVQEGTAIAGNIISKKMIGGRSNSYQLMYEYKPLNEPVHKGKMMVSSANYNAAAEGAEVVVLYDPGHPKRSLIYPYSDYEVP